MEKENFINAILNATDGINQVAPNVDLFSKIEQRIQATSKVPIETIWWVAASIAVLMAVNFGALSTKKQTTENHIVSSIAADINQSNQLY